jgi:hypothetical protein
MATQARDRRRRADSRLAEAREAYRLGRVDSEAIARDALALFASALNWAEDTKEFEPIPSRTPHPNVLQDVPDRPGAPAHRTPHPNVSLTHRPASSIARWSIEYIAKIIRCSICGRPTHECEHIAGRDYDGERCGRIIEEIDEILGVALVSRPAQPDARLTKVSIDTKDLRTALPPQWRPGMPVSCDICLRACKGVAEVDLTLLAREGDERHGSGPIVE